MISRTGFGFSSWLRSPMRRRCPMRWPPCWASPKTVSESVATALEGRNRLFGIRPERTVLERCSVFAGRFDLQSACAVTSSDDDFVILDPLDALGRKSLLVAD